MCLGSRIDSEEGRRRTSYFTLDLALGIQSRTTK